MPSLIRFVLFLAFLAALAFGAMVALSVFVEPNPRELSERVPTQKLVGEEI